MLVAVNPFRAIPNLYGSEAMAKYRGADLAGAPPHVYAAVNPFDAVLNLYGSEAMENFRASPQAG
ncbi:hypothetical protein T484DRAFT_1795695 [Baffinella frigidus]|nr:hypothetical protein T484DRAFT_1795695 [Cryptophyta sp. CCMP2293]